MHRPTKPSAERYLIAIVDGSLAGVIFLLPLMLGGRHPWGHLALAVLAATMTLAWAVHGWIVGNVGWRPTPAIALLLGGAAIVLLQCIPLPTGLLALLAPHNAQLLPLWTPDGLGSWRYISMTPAETQSALAMFVSFGLIFVVTVQRIRSLEDVERLLRWCALSATCMAVVGLTQFFAGNGKFLWFYEDPYGTATDAVKASFTNRNHFAQFLALGIGPLIWWYHESTSVSRRSSRENERLLAPFLALALVIVAFAGLLSLSRGGILAIALAAAICTVVCYRASAIGGRVVAALGGGILLVGIALFVFGYDRVATRLETVSSGSVEKLDEGAGRRSIWAATIASTANHLPVGSGAGSFAEVYPAYADVGTRDAIEFTHAESSPLQNGLETGLAGLALMLGGLVLCARWCLAGLAGNSPSRVRLCGAAITASLAANAMHALVDFVWYVPACMAVVTILAACAMRTAQMAQWPAVVRARRAPRVAYLAACGLLLPLIGWTLWTLYPAAAASTAWTRYRLGVNRLEGDMVRGDREKNSDDRTAEAERKLINELERVVASQPKHSRAHLELAESHLRLFTVLQATGENPMSLVNVRDAVLQSRFPSHGAMREWLRRAIGQHAEHLDRALHHARESLRLCPLHGRGYVYLAELCFLEDGTSPTTSDCIAQALRVRPYDATVLRGAASDAYLAGDQPKWLDYTKRAFHGGPLQQQQLIAELLGNTADPNIPYMVDFVVRELQPDLDGLRFLHNACAARCPAEQLAQLALYRAERIVAASATMDRTKAAEAWFEAFVLYSRLEKNDEALRCARESLDRNPDSYAIRKQVALWLLAQRRFADAEQQWRWCRQRAPNDAKVEANLKMAVKGRLEDERRATSGGGPLR